MSDQQTADASTAPVTTTPQGGESDDDAPLAPYDDRVADAMRSLREEERAAKAAQPADPAAPATDPATPDAKREERAKRLAALQDRERAAVEQQRKHSESDARRREEQAELEQLRSQAARARELEQAFSSPEAFLDFARGRIDEQALATWIRDGLADPTREAAARARREITPEVAALREELAAIKSQLSEREQRDQRESAIRTEREAQQHLVSAAQSRADEYPLTARMAANGESFIVLASAAAENLPAGAGADALFDVLETHFEQLASSLSSGNGTPPPRNSKPEPKPTPAVAAKTKTLSNSLASARSSVRAEDDEYISDYDERTRRAAEALFG